MSSPPRGASSGLLEGEDSELGGDGPAGPERGENIYSLSFHQPSDPDLCLRGPRTPAADGFGAGLLPGAWGQAWPGAQYQQSVWGGYQRYGAPGLYPGELSPALEGPEAALSWVAPGYVSPYTAFPAATPGLGRGLEPAPGPGQGPEPMHGLGNPFPPARPWQPPAAERISPFDQAPNPTASSRGEPFPWLLDLPPPQGSEQVLGSGAFGDVEQNRDNGLYSRPFPTHDSWGAPAPAFSLFPARHPMARQSLNFAALPGFSEIGQCFAMCDPLCTKHAQLCEALLAILEGNAWILAEAARRMPQHELSLLFPGAGSAEEGGEKRQGGGHEERQEESVGAPQGEPRPSVQGDGARGNTETDPADQVLEALRRSVDLLQDLSLQAPVQKLVVTLAGNQARAAKSKSEESAGCSDLSVASSMRPASVPRVSAAAAPSEAGSAKPQEEGQPNAAAGGSEEALNRPTGSLAAADSKLPDTAGAIAPHANDRQAMSGAIQEREDGPPRLLPRETHLRGFPRAFDLLNLVRQGCWVDDSEELCARLGMPPDIPSAALSYPYVTDEVASSARFGNSVEAILQCTIAALREGPLTREVLVERTRYQRKRISSALGPYLGLGLLLLPATLRACSDIDRVVLRSSPGSNMTVVRNVRLEAAGFAINTFCRYYSEIRRLRVLLQALVGHTGAPQRGAREGGIGIDAGRGMGMEGGVENSGSLRPGSGGVGLGGCEDGRGGGEGGGEGDGQGERSSRGGRSSRKGPPGGAAYATRSSPTSAAAHESHAAHASHIVPPCPYFLKVEFASQRLDELRRGEGKWKEIHRKEAAALKSRITFAGNPGS